MRIDRLVWALVVAVGVRSSAACASQGTSESPPQAGAATSDSPEGASDGASAGPGDAGTSGLNPMARGARSLVLIGEATLAAWTALNRDAR